jgi:peptide/nickel transport system substrate-binding protein
MLADSFSMAKNKLSYTIKLREGITFHDGSEFDAEDVVASLKRWGVVSGAGIEAFSHITSVTAKNPTTVQIKLDSPFTPLITSFADVRQAAIMMPSEIADAAGSDVLQDNQIIGTGPYKFASREPGSLITLERFKDYSSRSENWGGLAGAKAAYLDTLKYNIVTDAQVRVNGVQTDKYDFAVNIPQDLYEQVKTIPTVRPFIVSPYAWLAFVFNKAEPPFDDVRLRQAVANTLNLEQIGAAAVGNEDLYELDPSIFYAEQEGLHTTEGTELYNVQDVEKAKALMREAGYDGTPIRLLTTKDYPAFYKAAVAVASQLKDVGFTVEIQVFDWPTVLERREDAEAYDIFTTTSSPSFDPTSMTWMVPGAWAGFYESPAMEKLLDQWTATADPDAQQDLLAEMNRVVYTEVPEIKGPVLSALYVGGDGLEGYPNWMDATFWNVWLSDGK